MFLAVIQAGLVGARFGWGWGVASVPVSLFLFHVVIEFSKGLFEALPKPSRPIVKMISGWRRRRPVAKTGKKTCG